MQDLDRYEVIRPIGEGAAGGVFLVRDRLRGASPLALKRVHARADDLLRAAFEREFVVLASVSLRGIARVVDFGLAEPDGDDPGGPFFTRAFVEGEPLDLAARRKDPKARVRLVGAVCRVVRPLHRMGIVHGDLKPANIIVDGRGATHVIDFGLARLPSEGAGRGGVGTPAYMAPELLRGGKPSVVADVYALGATLWTLMTGAPPLSELGDRSLAARLAGELPGIPKGVDGASKRALQVALRALDPDALARLPAVDELDVALAEIVPTRAEQELPDGFVAPRPRGHEDVLAQLDARVTARTSGQAGEQTALLLCGARGGGKSTLLRELKWRLQVRGVRVIDIEVRPGSPLEPFASTLRQAGFLCDPAARATVDEVLGRFTRGELDDAGLVTATGVAIAAVAARGPTAVLVDDLDDAEGLLGRALRVALHADEAGRVALLAAATDPEAAAVRELGARQSVDVPNLDLDDIQGLARDALGNGDIVVARALLRHTSGRPAAVVDALTTLAGGSAATASDVESLPPGEAGEAAARARLASVDDEARPVLETAAACRAALPAGLLMTAAGVSAQVLEDCQLAGLLTSGPFGVAMIDRALRDALLDDMMDEQVVKRVRRVLEAPAAEDLPASTRAQLAVDARDGARVIAWVPQAAKELTATGAAGAAIGLWDGFRDHASGAEARGALLEIARLEHEVGRYDDAVANSLRLADDPDAEAEEKGAALVAAGRSCISAGRFDEAVELLERVSKEGPPAVRLLAAPELAKVHLRRGDYDAVQRVVDEGLPRTTTDDPTRVELLTSAGMVASYRGDHATARSHYHEAMSLARAGGSRRDEANVRTYLAIDHHRAGEHREARDLYTESLEAARQLGDIGSMATFALNLGAVCQELGEPVKAAENYETAGRLARRAGRNSTDVMARTNLANLHVYLGLYERARLGADGALDDAEEAGMKSAAAQATALLGDVAARTGDIELALSRYDDARARYRILGHRREETETLLDGAEALLDRGGPSDSSAAAARLADARDIVTKDEIEEFRLRLRLLLARARGESGDVDGAVAELAQVAELASAKEQRELQWQALAAAGFFHGLRGADFLARRHDQQAMEILESIATRLPRDHREAFWHDPRRRVMRRRSGATGEVAPRTALTESTFHGVGIEARAARLLELIKRLASEHDVDRLLERITDSAVELSGAERGFVLLVGGDGRLEPRTVRNANAQPPDPHVAFSQSIAEAVLIDGEPIITIDARDDNRLSEYMSVHKLMLKSVACLPIRGPSGTVGVLYLEHRMRRGRFDEGDVDLLFAFADQAAIALENARLIAENDRRRAELEQANASLAEAKAEIERVLDARTSELERTARELDRAREELQGNYLRHGIVGASEPMRKVFAIIDRVRDAAVPVVIQGESGTGKELIARAIHYGGPRAKKPFVPVNCAAIPEPLLESELFGHVRGAFTGADRDRRGVVAQASGGTLFLDEVSDMPPKMQVDLLRVLQDGVVRPVGGDRDEPVDIRIIAASNRGLATLVEEGRFREDLYYRLNVVEVLLPPLRDRPADIPLLCDHFLAAFAKRDGVAPKRISRAVLRRLAEHPMPGNVRQLEHVLLNAWVLVEGNQIDAGDLALDDSAVDVLATQRAAAAAVTADLSGPVRPPPQTLETFKADEKHRILAALEQHGWNRVRAATALGMPRRTFYRRLKEHDIL